MSQIHYFITIIIVNNTLLMFLSDTKCAYISIYIFYTYKLNDIS